MRARIKRLFLATSLVALFSTGVLAADPSITANPADICTSGVGSLTCSDTISWDKGTSNYAYYVVYMQIANQTTGRINAPYPGVKILCGPASTLGTGSHSFSLLQRSIYRFVFVGFDAACALQETWKVPINWAVLAEADVYVQ